MIKQFSAKDADNSLANTILPRAMVIRLSGFDICIIEKLLEVCRGKNGVVVINQIFWCSAVGGGLPDLLSYLCRGWIGSDGKMFDLSAVMADDNEDIGWERQKNPLPICPFCGYEEKFSKIESVFRSGSLVT